MDTHAIIQLKPEEFGKCQNIWDMGSHQFTTRFYHQMISGNRQTFIYTIDGEFIGEGSIVFKTADPNETIPGKRAYFSRLVIKEEYRNQGIGGKIIDYLTDHVRNLGFFEFTLGVDVNNANAHHLYAKKGFTNLIFEGEDKDGKYLILLKELT